MTLMLEVDENRINNVENNSFCQQNGEKNLELTFLPEG